MRFEYSSFGTDRFRQVHRRIAAQPNWVVRAALMTFVLIILLPIVLLVLIAFTLAILVFGVLGLVHRLTGLFPGRRGPLDDRGNQGRRNVTVLPRQS
ncbi:MAG: hypothetical protein IT430_05170 [Phycisphaerales bacterium]|nr:hypothetical protein [Phycisphaerales bacterium]